MSAHIVYLSHGGGPLPILGDAGHRRMVEFMKDLPTRIPRPKAIVVFSAHWEERRPHVIVDEEPGLYYDYYGFPSNSYDVDYPIKGDVALSKRILALLGGEEQRGRGWDHGVFIPLMLSFPEATIPVVQVSQLSSLDAGAHYRLGEALRPLLDEEILFIGSGFSFHNMRAFGRDDGKMNSEFQEYLISACTTEDPARQRELLLNWEAAPNARYCHPREEHLLSLHICAGLAQRAGTVIFDDQIMGKRATAYLWK
ncbi:MAG TPA: class III extradiol ring-cleavage dioxygenase [Sphaerochaeta sp.]|jgi:4,5-DOPA dioxygenase extradiol|nr:class III extradiol ring-cleavage dioxygenase [Sphaerochaeta sp.]HPZ16010.1 class III extradiol ring-cleavage dioxygenase [Sphaerochaeta sp.]